MLCYGDRLDEIFPDLSYHIPAHTHIPPTHPLQLLTLHTHISTHTHPTRSPTPPTHPPTHPTHPTHTSIQTHTPTPRRKRVPDHGHWQQLQC